MARVSSRPKLGLIVTDDELTAAFDLTAAFARGKAAWATIGSLTLEAFRSFVDGAAVEPAALEERASDLFLAAAAAGGNDDAVRVFESHVLSELPRWLSRLRLSSDMVEEVRQQLRAKLLVGPPPRLLQYRASGPLAGWVRMTAVRTALDMCEADPVLSGRLERGREPLLEALDQEQRLIRSRYGGLFQEALRDAVGRLSKRDRSLLRFHYVAGMSLDAIARTYRVHRATVARWLAAIRDELDSAVRVRLWDELGISTGEVRSLWNAVRSDVEVSISRLLAAE
jgi:RNA polymerase sigma-70 factor (ECF subfamily)